MLAREFATLAHFHDLIFTYKHSLASIYLLSESVRVLQERDTAGVRLNSCSLGLQ